MKKNKEKFNTIMIIVASILLLGLIVFTPIYEIITSPDKKEVKEDHVKCIDIKGQNQ